MANVGYHIRNVWLQKPPLGVQLNHAHRLTKGLVGCWLFNEGGGDKAYDLSGYNNQGTLKNMAFPPTATSGWNPGKDGVRLNFDGNSDYVDCGNDPSLDIAGAFTISFWAKFDVVPSNAAPQMILSRFVDLDNRYMLSFYAGMRFFSKNRGTASIDVGLAFAHGIQINTWNHWVLAKTGSNWTFFKDGAELGTAVDADEVSDLAAPLFIGSWYVGGLFNFKGSINRVKIYNRTLCAAEVQQLYIDPNCIFEPATKYTIIDERLRTKHIGTNIAAMQMLRGRTVI